MNTSLDLPAILARIDPQLRGRLGRLEVVDEIDSSNAELLRRGAAQPDCSVLLARRQTCGRGRRGRKWISVDGGSLCLSMAFRLKGGARAAGALSLVAGVSAAEALRALGYLAVGLKWPNDLLAHDRKLGGILVEMGGNTADDGCLAVIGIGVNLDLPDAVAGLAQQPVIDLARLGDHAPDAAAVAATMIGRLIVDLEDFRCSGFEPLRRRWESLDALRGREVRLSGATGEATGEAVGIADDGALCVLNADGISRHYSGEVSLRAV